MVFGTNKVIEELNSITGKVIEANNEIRRLGIELDKLRSAVEKDVELRQNQEEFLKPFQDNVGTITELRGEFEKELYNFKLLSGNIQKKLVEKVDEEIKKEMHDYFEKLRAELASFDEMRQTAAQIAADAKKANQQINMFLGIAENIKKSDFELTGYAKKLQEMDNEKLELMRKIDSLERLVSKMRRRV